MSIEILMNPYFKSISTGVLFLFAFSILAILMFRNRI